MPQPAPTEILLSAQQIHQRVAEIAAEIGRDAPGGVHLVAVLKGAFVFLSDLIRCMSGPVSLDFIAVSSYATGTTSSGEVRLLKDLDTTLEGRHVVIIEDIVDTGLTLAYILGLIQARGARSVRVCALLDKPSRRRVEVPVDYVGFSVGDAFVVGYGLDCAEQYRNLPALCELLQVPENP